jgi:hypothetical protein
MQRAKRDEKGNRCIGGTEDGEYVGQHDRRLQFAQLDQLRRPSQLAEAIADRQPTRRAGLKQVLPVRQDTVTPVRMSSPSTRVR